MGILKNIGADIRRGENIDLFVTVIVAIGLVVLNLVGIAPATWIAPLNLAILGLLAIAMLVNRYKLDEGLENLRQVPNTLFQEKFPPNLDSDLEKSKELWLVGVTLGRTIKTHYYTVTLIFMGRHIAIMQLRSCLRCRKAPIHGCPRPISFLHEGFDFFR